MYSKVELDDIWHEANDTLKDLLLAIGGFPLTDGEAGTGLNLWLKNYEQLTAAEAFIYNLMTLPLGVYAPEVANLPQVATWAWNPEAFRDLLETCISGLVANDEHSQRRLEAIR